MLYVDIYLIIIYIICLICIFKVYKCKKYKIFNDNIDFLANILNIESLKYIKNSILNRLIPVKDLKEGMIVNDCYFNNEDVIELLDDIDGNLKVYKTRGDDDFEYYFKSKSAGGITNEEMWQLKIMRAQDLIPDNISIKVSFPFTPAILFGFIIAVLYGDVMMLFAKNLVLAI